MFTSLQDMEQEDEMRIQNSYDIAQARKREGEINVTPFKGKPAQAQPGLA